MPRFIFLLSQFPTLTISASLIFDTAHPTKGRLDIYLFKTLNLLLGAADQCPIALLEMSVFLLQLNTQKYCPCIAFALHIS